ncbi:hypothetical protein FDZ71_15745 [bacterium]|nr:MAG: hypothetical protein FDZ71_15745 [bacterium]
MEKFLTCHDIAGSENAMSIPYVPSSMKNTDENHLRFAIVNKVESGSASIGAKLIIDGVDYTDRATIQIEDQRPQKLGTYVYISTAYGDRCTIKVDHEGKIKPGKHKVKVTVDTPIGSYNAEFEDTA